MRRASQAIRFIMAGVISLGALAGPAFALSNGDPAVGVLGPSDFITRPPGQLGAAKFSAPSAVAIDPRTNKLFVADAPANYVLGQALFTTNASPNPPNAASLAQPRGLFVQSTLGELWVADSVNNRVLRYDVSSLVPVEVSEFSVE